MELEAEIFSYYYYLHIFCELHLQISWSSTCYPLLFFQFSLNKYFAQEYEKCKVKIVHFTIHLASILPHQFIHSNKNVFLKIQVWAAHLTLYCTLSKRFFFFFFFNKDQNGCDLGHFIFIINVWPHCVAAV